MVGNGISEPSTSSFSRFIVGEDPLNMPLSSGLGILVICRSDQVVDSKLCLILYMKSSSLRLHGMSWGVKTTCFKAPGVSLGRSGVSIGGVRSLRVWL